MLPGKIIAWDPNGLNPPSPFLIQALLSRRSRWHVGTRYNARGINSNAGPGNEVECEQVRSGTGGRQDVGVDLITMGHNVDSISDAFFGLIPIDPDTK